MLAPAHRNLKGVQAEGEKGGHLVPRGEEGFFGPWGKLCLSAEESSELDPAVAGGVIGWCWIKSQQAEGEGKCGACAFW